MLKRQREWVVREGGDGGAKTTGLGEISIVDSGSALEGTRCEEKGKSEEAGGADGGA